MLQMHWKEKGFFYSFFIFYPSVFITLCSPPPAPSLSVSELNTFQHYIQENSPWNSHCLWRLREKNVVSLVCRALQKATSIWNIVVSRQNVFLKAFSCPHRLSSQATQDGWKYCLLEWDYKMEAYTTQLLHSLKKKQLCQHRAKWRWESNTFCSTISLQHILELERASPHFHGTYI